MAFDCQTCGACCAAGQIVPIALVKREADRMNALAERTVAVRFITTVPARVKREYDFDAVPAIRDRLVLKMFRGRCHFLDGEIGGAVGCREYEKRPASCQHLQPGDPACNVAREAHGLPPLKKG